MEIQGKELDEWREQRNKTVFPDDPMLEKISALYFYSYSIGTGAVGVSTFEPIDNSKLEIIKKFRNVFLLSYRRFRDIVLAEKQAREAQIEAALERVRARSMAMHKSEELTPVVNLLYEQFKNFNITDQSTDIEIGFIDDKTKIATMWASSFNSNNTFVKFQIPFAQFPLLKDELKIYLKTIPEKRKDLLITNIYKGEIWKKFTNLLASIRKSNENQKRKIKQWVTHNAYFSHGLLNLQGVNSYLPEDVEVLSRFAKTFEQTYTRFLDFKKAEAQARESEIQLALERVRARTMAMHKSDELAETAAILFQQMTELGVTPERINICLIKEADNILEVWATDQQGIKISHHFNASLDEPTTGKRIYDAWKEKKKSIVIDLSGKELNDWIRYVREVMGMTIKDELVREHRIHSVAFFSQGLILTTTPEPLPEESIKLLERFADVFNLTYRRFLDLQKAEAQAREAEIQACA